MAHNLVHSDSFLTAEQEAPLQTLRDFNRQLEFPTDTTESVIHQLTTSARGMLSLNLDEMKRQHAESKQTRSVESIDDMRCNLRVAARQIARLDLYLHSMRHLTAMVTGVYQSDTIAGDAEEGYELGHQLISEQSTRMATYLLLGNIALMDPDARIGETESVWKRVRDLHAARPQVGPKRVIGEAEGARHDALLDRVRQYLDEPEHTSGGIKISKYRALNILRMGGRAIKLGLKWRFDRTLLENMKLAQESMFAQIETPMALSADDINHARHTIDKKRLFLNSAIKLDSSLRTDPRVGFLSFLFDNVTVGDPRGEVAVFDRNVRKYAKQHQRANQ